MSALRARLGAADPWVAVVGLVSLVVYALHRFDGVIKRDLGVYLYGAQRFLAGDPPYVGILNRAGPLVHALPAVGIWVGDVHAARYLATPSTRGRSSGSWRASRARPAALGS